MNLKKPGAPWATTITQAPYHEADACTTSRRWAAPLLRNTIQGRLVRFRRMDLESTVDTATSPTLRLQYERIEVTATECNKDPANKANTTRQPCQLGSCHYSTPKVLAGSAQGLSHALSRDAHTCSYICVSIRGQARVHLEKSKVSSLWIMREPREGAHTANMRCRKRA